MSASFDNSNQSCAHQEQSLGLTDIIDARLRQGAVYWCALKQGNQIPSRYDVDPITMPKSLLPWVTLTIRENDNFRISLSGTGNYQIHGRELTGHCISEISKNHHYNIYAQNLYQRVCETRKPIFGQCEYSDDTLLKAVACVITPLTTDGTEVSQTLGFEVAVKPQESTYLKMLNITGHSEFIFQPIKTAPLSLH